jgi:Na+/citrate or Na+/malate symporter
MNTQPTNQDKRPENIDARMRTMRTLWFALLLSVVMYYVFSLVAERPENPTPNNTLSLALMVVAVSMVLVSFLVKNKLLNQAIDLQQTQRVQQAYIVALAICEVPALLGLLDFFITGNRYYYVLMIIAVCGQLLHFPRREHVENAAFKRM